MDENRNPEELLLALSKDLISPEQFNNLANKMKKKSGAWESNGYGPDKEIEAIANREVEETSPLSSSNGLNIRNRKLSESGSGPKHVPRAAPQNHIDFKSKHFHSGYRTERRNFKEFDKRYKDGRRPERKEWGTQNGKMNGYHANDVAVKTVRDGIGSESGSGQWRWKGRRNSRDSVGSLEDKSRSPVDGKESSPKQDSDRSRSSSSMADPNRPSHSSSSKPSGRYTSPASHGVKNEGEGMHRNQVGKPPAAKKPEDRPKGKVSTSVVADDSWSLFKPPPVFPVDNSSAKIVPKISYASKVKENLNKVPVEPVVQHPGKPVQVPASAVKTIASNGLPNGILCNSSDTHPSAASSPAPPIADQPHPQPQELVSVSEHTSVIADNGPSSSPPQSNGHHLEASLPPPGQQNLGAIFQNEWGLSFINDPGTDPEKSRDMSRTEGLSDNIPPAPGNVDVPSREMRDSEARNSPDPSLVNPTVDSSNRTSPGSVNGATVKDSEGLNVNHSCLDSVRHYNLEAIVSYHIKEWEQIWKRHKQDPKKVVTYNECLEQVV